MPTGNPPSAPGIDDDVDPRRARSRARLVDAAVALLRNGGVEAVTANAVSRASKVARTTLYRHFDTTTDLLAAAFERLLPDAVEPDDFDGSARDCLIDLMNRHAEVIESSSIHLTSLAWLAICTNATEPSSRREKRLAELREKVVHQYRAPFDRFFDSAVAHAELGEIDHDLAILQLGGPLVFARLSGTIGLTAADRERIVDDSLAAHATASG